MERWVEGFEGYYSVDTNGNIYSYHKKEIREAGYDQNGNPTVVFHPNKLPRKLGKSTAGYVRTFFETEFGQRQESVHRVVAKTFIPNPHNYEQVNHKNGNKADNRVENLEWVSPKQNIHHAIKIGLFKPDTKEKCEARISAASIDRAKFTSDEASEIFEMMDVLKLGINETCRIVGCNSETLKAMKDGKQKYYRDGKVAYA